METEKKYKLTDECIILSNRKSLQLAVGLLTPTSETITLYFNDFKSNIKNYLL